MFLDRLSAELAAPQNHLSELDERLHLDLDRYRALLMQEARALCDGGHIDPEVVAWAFSCIADGWVDEHVQHLRDGLLELGGVADQGHLDRLLRAAVLQILGTQDPLPPADALLLSTVTQPLRAGDAEPLGLRLMARRYARELGLLSGSARTRLGDVARRLPRGELPVFLLALETFQSTGAADRWRTPRRALQRILSEREFIVPTTEEARRQRDPDGLFPWRRVRRLTLMGLCEPLPAGPADADGADSCRHRLSSRGQLVLEKVLAEPRAPVVNLAAATLEEQSREMLRPLLQHCESQPAARVAVSAAPPRVAVSAQRRMINGSGSGSGSGTAVLSARPQRPEAPAPVAPARPAVATHAPPLGVAVPAAPPAATSSTTPSASSSTTPSTEARTQATMRPAVAVQREAAGTEDLIAALNPPPATRGVVDIADLVQRAWDELQARHVQFSLRGTAEPVGGERRALLQLLREVLRCAAEAASRGGRAPQLQVDLQVEGRFVHVVVSDNGPPRAPAETPPKNAAAVQELLVSRAGPLRVPVDVLPPGVSLTLPLPRLGGLSVALVIPLASALAREAA